jgi:rubredoxin
LLNFAEQSGPRKKVRLNLKWGSNIQEINMKTWQCIVCGFIYDEAQGLPEDGIAPGTLWADIPDSWSCPDCGVEKSDFEMVQVS